jgi:hypothetical protein
VVVNGGEIALAEVAQSLSARRPVVAVAGTGRSADRLAGAARGARGARDPDGAATDERATALTDSGLITVAGSPADPAALARTLARLLGGSPSPGPS